MRSGGFRFLKLPLHIFVYVESIVLYWWGSEKAKIALATMRLN
ncbi:hypothetical protein [Azospirillum largimobile]